MLYFEVDNLPPISMNFEDLQWNIINISTLIIMKNSLQINVLYGLATNPPITHVNTCNL
jgi:hypothetical protein